MIKGPQLIDWELAGAMLAQLSSVEQGAFLRSFLKECRSFGTAHATEMQLVHVNHELSAEDRQLLKILSYEEGD